LCLPYQMLKPITPRLNKHLWFEDSDRSANHEAHPQTAKTRRTIINTPVEVRALLGSATITVAELLDLQEGDCVVLDRQEKEELPLLIAGQERLCGRLGIVGRRYGMLITDWIDDDVGGPATSSTGSEDDSHDSE
jgi:flagellar motor switch protein FliM